MNKEPMESKTFEERLYAIESLLNHVINNDIKHIYTTLWIMVSLIAVMFGGIVSLVLKLVL